MLANVWRALVALADWRNILRIAFRLPLVVFVTNMRDEKDRRNFLGGWRPPEGHFNGPRYWINLVAGRTRALDVTAKEIYVKSGRRKAIELFFSACKWAEKKKAKVILLAAATKRLFDADPEQIKKKYPQMVFTIGDNGTILLLKEDTLRALNKSGLKPGCCRIAILGPYGFLGEHMTKILKGKKYDIIGAGPNIAELMEVKEKYGIDVCETFAEVGKVDAVVACTHSEKISLNAESSELLRREGKKLLVVDVAEPSNLIYEEYKKCQHIVIRQDSGNAYAPRLKYVLGAITYKMFRLSRGVTFGCFAEAMALAWALDHGYAEEVRRKDWFIISEDNMEFVAKLFEELGFTVPSPRCFGKPVKSFNLDL